MHQFLPAIGFSKLNKEMLAELLDQIMVRPDYQESAIDVDGNQFVELRYMVADGIGLVLRGVYNEDDEFILDYYYPTFFGKNKSSEADVDIIKQTDKENYYVMADEIKLGVSLIFHLQNMGEFLRVSNGKEFGETKGIRLAGLSCEGKVILPVYDTESDRNKAKINQQKRNSMIEAARGGDEQAIESLTIDDIDLYAKISRRVVKEDILSIVTSYFMPYGIENDKYEILGEILEVNKVENHLTMEEMYTMVINCNDVVLELCINKDNLLGEPAVGRRFKGSMWLQGTVDFY